MDAIRGAREALAATAADSPKLRKAAQDFEAVLLGSVLEQMEESVQEESDDSGSGDLRGLGVEQLARAWAQNGGVGIARIILPQLQKQSSSPGISTKLKLPTDLPMIVKAGLNPTAAK